MAISRAVRTWPRPRSPSSAPTTSASAGCGPRSRARRSARSRSPNPTPAPTSPAIRTRAVRDGDVWRVNGRKMFITNGARADFLTLVAKTDPDAGPPRRVAVPRRHVAAGRLGVAAAREARHARVRHRRDRARRRRGARARSHRPRTGPRLPAADVAVAVRAAGGAAACVGHAAQTLDETIAYARERRRSDGRSRSTK